MLTFSKETVLQHIQEKASEYASEKARETWL